MIPAAPQDQGELPSGAGRHAAVSPVGRVNTSRSHGSALPSLTRVYGSPADYPNRSASWVSLATHADQS
jgi:hypothetical protein